MPNLDSFITAAALASNVQKITDSLPDAAIAGGFGAWISSLTGSSPYVVGIGDNRAKVYLSEEQITIVRKWLDEQVGKSLVKPQEPPKVVYELGPVLAPWALKYALPAGIMIFVAGIIAHMLYVRYIR